VKTKLGGVVLEVPVLAARNNIQGTATCFPLLDDEPRLLPPVVLLPPTALLLPELLVSEEVPVEELVPLGLVAAPVLLAPEELNDRTAKSMRPEPGLMMTSLIEPIWLPELPVTCAPVNWLARNSWWLI
jgi:hypothetical protein